MDRENLWEYNRKIYKRKGIKSPHADHKRSLPYIRPFASKHSKRGEKTVQETDAAGTSGCVRKRKNRGYPAGSED